MGASACRATATCSTVPDSAVAAGTGRSTGCRDATAKALLIVPREPSEQNAAWTETLGEVLKDLYRLARIPAGDRIFVYLESERLRRYMAGRQHATGSISTAMS